MMMVNLLEDSMMTIQLDPDDEQREEGMLNGFPDGEPLVITKVEREPKSDHRYILYFGPLALSVHEDIMIKYRMTSESTFTKEELQEIILADERQRAYILGLRYLERKPRTTVEMEKRLRQKEFGEAIIAEVLDRLGRERLLDDGQYARQWAEQRVTGHRKGRLWVRYELQSKGIDKEIIAEALDGISVEQERRSALELGAKKWNTVRGETGDKWRKTGAFLMRRGFSAEIVRSVLSSLKQEEHAEYDEDNEFGLDGFS